jgi:hypothetical protein
MDAPRAHAALTEALARPNAVGCIRAADVDGVIGFLRAHATPRPRGSGADVAPLDAGLADVGPLAWELAERLLKQAPPADGPADASSILLALRLVEALAGAYNGRLHATPAAWRVLAAVGARCGAANAAAGAFDFDRIYTESDGAGGASETGLALVSRVLKTYAGGCPNCVSRMTAAPDPDTGEDNAAIFLSVAEAAERSSRSSHAHDKVLEQLSSTALRLWTGSTRPLDRVLQRMVVVFGRIAEAATARGAKSLAAASGAVVMSCLEYDQTAAVAALVTHGVSPPHVKRQCVKDPMCVIA